MQRTTRPRRPERATATAEWAGIAAVVAVLLVGLGGGLGGEGDALGRSIGARLGAIVSGEPRRWRSARELRRGGGSVPVRVSRDELRMSPFLDERAVASHSREWTGERAGIRGSLSTRGCLLCANAEWSHQLGPGAGIGSSGGHAGIAADVEATGRLALASAQVDGLIERDLGPHGAAFAQGRLRGTVGAEADAAARLQLAPAALDAEIDAGAMVGAIAKAEARAGIDLLGVSIRQAGRAEGWAGAGIRGTAGVRRTPGIVAWRFGWGGALGLGGAGEWSGTVDASAIPQRHREVAGSALAIAVRSALGLPSLPPIHPHIRKEQ